MLRVVVSSPSDLVDDRQIVRGAIYQWNDRHADEVGVVLLPVMMETHGVPQMGDHPQTLLNKQLVEGADVLVALFWTRLGTPTPDSESGTTSEINRFLSLGRPVLLYLCKRDVPANRLNAASLSELTRLNSYLDSIRHRGFFGDYGSDDDLRSTIEDHLTRTVRSSVRLTAATPNQTTYLKQARDLEGQWIAARDARLQRVNNGKLIVNQALSLMSRIRSETYSELSEEQRKSLEDLLRQAGDLRLHRVMIDGGVSLRAFWDRGTQLIDTLLAWCGAD